MRGKSVFFSEGTAGQMKSAPSFAKDDDFHLYQKNRMEARSRTRTEEYLRDVS